VDAPRRIDPLAEAFAGIAEAYDRARPGYDSTPIDWLWGELELGRGSTVVDLAAGTGKLSRALAGRGGHLIAIEPQGPLRDLLERRVPEADVLDGTAESIPLPDGAADAVLVGEAFHWFDGGRALPEIHRVLRARGGLALLWHDGRWEGPWADELFARLDQVPTPDVRPENRPHTKLWQRAFEGSELFDPLRRETFARTLQLSIPEAIDLITSWSYVAARPAEERDEIRLELAGILRRHLDDGPVEIDYRTAIDVTRRRP
jgi:SAM-dependent methyltransferase